jgi:hypothetical protein
MASITYTSLSTLQPIELKYQFYTNEELSLDRVSLKDGYTFYQNPSLKGYQDATINQETCLVLTSAIDLNKVFTGTKKYEYGKLPGSILIQPQPTSLYYGYYDELTNSITLNEKGTPLYLSPIPETNEIEIFIDKKILQIEENYPFKAVLSTKSLSQKDIHRQRFICVYQNPTITFKTKTKDGFRYLSFNPIDNILRAVGVMFNNSIVNNYVLNCVPVSENELNVNFKSTNNWLTYFFTLDDEENKNTQTTINKNITTTTNLLFNFSVENATKTGLVNINIANLKTNVTPLGGPAPVDNSPEK